MNQRSVAADRTADSGERVPYVTFLLDQGAYGISATYVQTMLETPEVTPVPHAPDYVRGIVNLRGASLPLVDLRRRLGLTSAQDELDEFTAMLQQREQDHRNWLKELEASVREERAFALTTDPHQCAFGQWFDNFTSENLTLQAIVHKFEQPHRRIHGVADRVRKAAAAGDFTQAHAIIDATRENELAQMIRLFAEVAAFYRNEARETVLVIETAHCLFAVAVDAVTAVESITDENLMANPAADRTRSTSAMVTAMGRRPQSEQMVQILDPVQLCDPAVLVELPQAAV